MYYVYLLYVDGVICPALGKPGSRDTYVGFSSDVSHRLVEHNAGKCVSTRGRKWRLVAWLSVPDRIAARIVEMWLKVGDTRGKRLEMALNAQSDKEVLPSNSADILERARRWYTNRYSGIDLWLSKKERS